jgi:hypothetical protein
MHRSKNSIISMTSSARVSGVGGSLNFPSPLEIARKVATGIAAWKDLDPRNPDPIVKDLGYEYSLSPILDRSVKPVPVRERRPDLPPKLAEVVDRAVRKCKSERFASAISMREALLAAIA